ncbi:hypothetical protein NC652_007604 [Populus alba x Populus x berolinensis]|nr:hypothetical protein NC652_007604 [Populus alba x Populus x berolinensis]
MDGRVHRSGAAYPPWNAFVAQLPPAKRNAVRSS